MGQHFGTFLFIFLSPPATLILKWNNNPRPASDLIFIFYWLPLNLIITDNCHEIHPPVSNLKKKKKLRHRRSMTIDEFYLICPLFLCSFSRKLFSPLVFVIFFFFKFFIWSFLPAPDPPTQQWHALGREEQAKYYELARKERQMHMQLHPGWTARDNYAQGKKRKRRREKPSEAGGRPLTPHKKKVKKKNKQKKIPKSPTRKSPLPFCTCGPRYLVPPTWSNKTKATNPKTTLASFLVEFLPFLLLFFDLTRLSTERQTQRNETLDTFVFWVP